VAKDKQIRTYCQELNFRSNINAELIFTLDRLPSPFPSPLEGEREGVRGQWHK
jgi:hypothetical protein